MQDSQNLYLPILVAVGRDERDIDQHQLAQVGDCGWPAGARETFQLLKPVQDSGDYFNGFCIAGDAVVVLVNSIKITVGFFSQYYARHALPT